MKQGSYPALRKLKVPVHTAKGHFDYVLSADLDARLTEAERRRFGALFGVQTCPCVDEGLAMYAWDAEAVLVRMKTGRLTGSQLLWD
jgi:hypothetical protein